MKTTFYAVNEINPAKGVKIPKGGVVAVLETPDGLPLDAAIRALGNGLATRDVPKNTAPAATTSAPRAEK